MRSINKFLIISVLVATILVEASWLLAPFNHVSYRRTERMKALREWAAARTPETQAVWESERRLLDTHLAWINLGVFSAMVAGGALAVYIIRRRTPPANAS
jgi:hypothetical protein